MTEAKEATGPCHWADLLAARLAALPDHALPAGALGVLWMLAAERQEPALASSDSWLARWVNSLPDAVFDRAAGAIADMDLFGALDAEFNALEAEPRPRRDTDSARAHWSARRLARLSGVAHVFTAADLGTFWTLAAQACESAALFVDLTAFDGRAGLGPGWSDSSNRIAKLAQFGLIQAKNGPDRNGRPSSEVLFVECPGAAAAILGQL